jgi:hypothetical protein
MTRNLRAVGPMVYAALVIVGFLINPVVGGIVVIVGGIALGAFFVAIRGNGAPTSSRRPPRNRNRS